MQRSISLLFCRSGACAMENLQNSHKETAIPTFLAGGIVIECIRKIMRLPQSCNFAQTQAAPLVPPTQGAVSEADWGLHRQAVLSFKRSNCKLAQTPSLRCAPAAPCRGGTRGGAAAFHIIRAVETPAAPKPPLCKGRWAGYHLKCNTKK